MKAFMVNVSRLVDSSGLAGLATKCQIKPRTMQQWLTADREPGASDAVSIAQALGTTVEALVTGKHPGDDPWIAENFSLVADLKEFDPAELEFITQGIHAQAEAKRAARRADHANAMGSS